MWRVRGIELGEACVVHDATAEEEGVPTLGFQVSESKASGRALVKQWSGPTSSTSLSTRDRNPGAWTATCQFGGQGLRSREERKRRQGPPFLADASLIASVGYNSTKLAKRRLDTRASRVYLGSV